MAYQVIMTKREGKVTFDKELAYLFQTLKNGQYTITIKRTSERRTIAQNDLLWMWLTCIGRETGSTKEEVYMYYCKKFLLKTITLGEKREKVYMTSSKLSTAEMTEFLNKIQADAEAEFGITLPQPQDIYFEAFYADYYNSI